MSVLVCDIYSTRLRSEQVTAVLLVMEECRYVILYLFEVRALIPTRFCGRCRVVQTVNPEDV